MNHIFLGIDPGQKGAIAAVDPVKFWPMPTFDGDIDGGAIRNIFCEYQPMDLLVCIESVHSMPKQGVASVFTFGKGFGVVLGVMQALSISYILVTPQTWKKVVLVGLDWKGSKVASEVYVRNLYPDLELPRAKDKRSGVCDALCLAEYGAILSGRGCDLVLPTRHNASKTNGKALVGAAVSK